MIWGPILKKMALVLVMVGSVGFIALELGDHGRWLEELQHSSPKGGMILTSAGASGVNPPPQSVAENHAQLDHVSVPPPPPPPTPVASPPVGVSLWPPPPPPVFAAPVSAADKQLAGMCKHLPNTDQKGGDIGGQTASKVQTPDACCQLCHATVSCQAWTYVHEDGMCWLKSFGSVSQRDDCCTSGLLLKAPPGSRPAINAASSHSPVVGGAAMTVLSNAKGIGEPQMGAGAPSLLIAVPTIPRVVKATTVAQGAMTAMGIGEEIDYLTHTIESLVKECAGTNLFSSVEILVVAHAEVHGPFEKLKLKYGKGSSFTDPTLKLSFMNDGAPSKRRADPHRDDQPEVDDHKNPDDRPGIKVRQQTLDVVSLATASEGRADYVLLTEDDAELCEGALLLVRQSIDESAQARPDGQWSMVRFSIGFIGILFQAKAMPALERFFLRYYLLKPPDLLLIEWIHGDWPGSVRADGLTAPPNAIPGCAAVDCDIEPVSIPEWTAFLSTKPNNGPLHGQPPAGVHFTSKTNLWDHKGYSSSLRTTGAAQFPKCGMPLSSHLWALEHFHPGCRATQISPCGH